jgi:FkbM family methyltransferase
MLGLGRLKQQVLNVTGKAYGLAFRNASTLNVNLYSHSTPLKTVETKYGSLVFSCENQLTLWRASTFFKKEPDTLEWIDSMKPGEILFDVGANVGLYTLYAAKKGIKVYAFEPESQNYAILNRNIYLNGLQDRVVALNLALSDTRAIDYLYLSSMDKGASLHTVHENVDFAGNEFQAGYRQGVLATTMDSLVDDWNLPRPDHIKMDVDGHESGIVRGARDTISHAGFKSLLVELNTDVEKDRTVIADLTSCGLKQTGKRQTTGGDGTRFSGVHNFIFSRRSTASCDHIDNVL